MFIYSPLEQFVLLYISTETVGFFDLVYLTLAFLTLGFILAKIKPKSFLNFGRFLINFFNLFLPGNTPVLISPILVLIEVVSYFTRVLSLAVRLFANMIAGHILIKVALSLLMTACTNNFTSKEIYNIVERILSIIKNFYDKMTTFFGMNNFGKVSIENLDSKQVEVTNIIVKKNNHGLIDILYAFIVLCILVLCGIALVWWETLGSYLPIDVLTALGNDGPKMLIPGEDFLKDKFPKKPEDVGEQRATVTEYLSELDARLEKLPTYQKVILISLDVIIVSILTYFCFSFFSGSEPIPVSSSDEGWVIVAR